MSPEAELLAAIDSLAAMAGQAPDPAAVPPEVRQIRSLAAALEFHEAAEAATRLEQHWTGGDPKQVVELLIEELSEAANLGLARRFGAAADPEPTATPREFFDESREHIDSIERELLALEQSPENIDAVHAVFRGFHTIKGLAAVFDMPSVRDFAHHIESMLDRVRNGRLAVTPELIDVGLECADSLRAMLDGGSPDCSDLLDRVGQICALDGEAAPGSRQAAEPRASAAARKAGSTLKVDTAKLDQLVDLVGELVIAQSLVESDPYLARVEEPRLAKNLARLKRMTGQLQKSALSMRLVPVGPMFQRLSRTFRDLTRRLGKQAVLEIEGEGIEIDRTILEQLGDPLMHMVRNAVDHGLETGAEREAKGKPPTGRVRLAASHRSGHIQIEISDDGRGIDSKKVLARAVECGLVAPQAGPAPDEVLQLIFEPGLSTADRLTDLSGRGVGMDVVRRQVEKLRGRVEIRSEPGTGTSFLLRLPLTLAIIDGLLVRVGGVRYILPLFAVREMFRPDRGAVKTIEGKSEVVMVRNRAIPVLRLAALTGQPCPLRDPSELVAVRTSCCGHDCCLLVDELEGKQEVVIKSLGDWFGHLRGISGGAILGDGTVGLILDLEGLLGGNVYGAAA